MALKMPPMTLKSPPVWDYVFPLVFCISPLFWEMMASFGCWFIFFLRTCLIFMSRTKVDTLLKHLTGRQKKTRRKFTLKCLLYKYITRNHRAWNSLICDQRSLEVGWTQWKRACHHGRSWKLQIQVQDGHNRLLQSFPSAASSFRSSACFQKLWQLPACNWLSPMVHQAWAGLL